ncbi:MAG: hypothetical protein AAF371_08920 [Pseudomonadota bacterium]
MSYYDEAVMMTYRLGRWNAGVHGSGLETRALGVRRRPRPQPAGPAPWSFLRLVP